MFKKTLSVIGASTLLASTAHAAADYSSLTQGVDFGSAVTAVVAIAAAIAGVYVAIAGSRAVLRMIKSA